MHKKRAVGIALALVLCIALAAAAGGYFYLQSDAGQKTLIAFSGARIEPVYQFDYRKAVRVGGSTRSVASSGCGPTSLSMAITYLTGNTEQDPQELFDYACEYGEYKGGGFEHGTLTRLAARYGVQGEWIDGEDPALVEALRQGKPVIAHMGAGKFTESGHYILLRGMTFDGKVVVNDPNSEENTWQTHDLEQIIAETKSNSPFMVCTLAQE